MVWGHHARMPWSVLSAGERAMPDRRPDDAATTENGHTWIMG